MKKNILAVGLGFLLSILILTGIEVFFRLNENFLWIKKTPVVYEDMTINKEATDEVKNFLMSSEIWTWRSRLPKEIDISVREEGASYEFKGKIGCCLLHNGFAKPGHVRSLSQSNITKSIVYDVTFTFDDFGRRITPEVKNPKSQIIMFGDSYTLGEGVEDIQTTSYQLGLLRPDTKVYNLGLSGGSPNQFYYEVTQPARPRIDSIPENIQTKIIFSTMDHHLERMFCRSICLKPPDDWVLDLPYYSLKSGKFIFKGAFSERYFLNSIYKFLSHSTTLQFFGIVIPPRFTQYHFDYFAKMIKESENILKKKFGKDTQFFLVFYPGFSGIYAPSLSKSLISHGVKVLDYSEVSVILATENNESINGDGHPNPLVHYGFSYLLNKDLPR